MLWFAVHGAFSATTTTAAAKVEATQTLKLPPQNSSAHRTTSLDHRVFDSYPRKKVRAKKTTEERRKTTKTDEEVG